MYKTTYHTYKRNLRPATRGNKYINCFVCNAICYSLTIPDHAYSIPQTLDQDELSKLVNEIIGDLCTMLSM